jgi:ribosomal protein L11 methyltransferase
MTNKQDVWYGLEVTANEKAEEAIEFALNELDALGTEINNLGPRRSSIKINGYFNERLADEAVAARLKDALLIYGLPPEALNGFEWSQIENRDWLAEWKKHWRPTETGQFIIAPPWETVEATDKIVIMIEPNMAFGTGTHETTQLCLRAIGELYRSRETFLDVGTGTGILAIAAARIQGKSQKSKGKILACDTDADSVKIAIENASLNGVGDLIEFFEGPIGEETPDFDLVCANLTIDVIIPILPLLLSKARGRLLLSGILVEQQEMISSELGKVQISNFKIETAGEWVSVLIEK